MSEPVVRVSTYVRSDRGDDVPIAKGQSVNGKREHFLGAIEFDVRYRASFQVRVADDIDYLWPFFGKELAQFVLTGNARQPTSFGDTIQIIRDTHRGRATLSVTPAGELARQVSLLERDLLSELAREAEHVAEHLLRLTGSSDRLANDAATFRPAWTGVLCDEFRDVHP